MTATFDEVHRPAAILAEALLGRPVRVEVDERQPPSGRRPLDALGTEAVVVLPPSVDELGDDALDRRVMRQAVLRQVAYELCGTRRFDVPGFLAAHDDRPGLAVAFGALEEARLDAVLRATFPGARDDLARSGTLAPPLRGSLREVVDAVAGRADLVEWTVDDVAALALACCPQGEVLGDAELAELLLPSDPERAPGHDAGEGGGERVGELDPTVLHALGFAADVDDLLDAFDVDGAGTGDELPDEAPARGRGLRKEAARRPDRPPRRPRPDRGPERSYLYDEWDVNAGEYLRAWCRVRERPLSGGDPSYVVEVRRRHAALARQVRRHFSRLASESWRRVRRERDGGELDLDEVVASLVDRRRGIVDDDHLHVRQVRARREVAAAFLLDMSASTSTPVVDPDAPPPPPIEEPEHLLYRAMPFEDLDLAPYVPERRILDLAKESLALMCDALHVLGDDHAIYGFSGDGRDDVEFYVAKDLEEAVSARTWARLDAMQPRRYTRMGPAIRHTVRKLRGHPARTRLLVVVSDGFPQDRDYGPDRADHAYGIADTAKALEEAERAGIVTFCITVDPAGHDYLREMCPDERYLVIDDVRQLPDELTKVYRSLALHRTGRMTSQVMVPRPGTP